MERGCYKNIVEWKNKKAKTSLKGRWIFTLLVSGICGLWTTSSFGGSDAWGGRPSHLAVVNPPVPTDDGRVLSLRGEWEFSAFRHAIEGRDLRYMHERNFWGEEPEGWKNLRKINVPGCWEAQGVGEPGPGISYQGEPVAKWAHRHVHVGNGFYRKRVRIPESWRGQRVWLKVGRVQSRGWFWVDGKPVAHVNEAHRALKWEITDLVRPGAECTILAEVDNTYPFRNSQIYTYNRWGGLIRDVELEATPGVFMDEVWVRGDFDRQVAEAHVEMCLGGLERLESTKVRVTVGEGNSDFKLYLAAKTRPDGGREVFVSGLDVFCGTVEGNRLYSSILKWAAGGSF